MNNVLNEKFSKHVDRKIYDVLIDFENLQNSVTVYEKLLYLNGVLTKLANTESKFSFEFIADALCEISLICRELHKERVESLAVFENQEFPIK